MIHKYYKNKLGYFFMTALPVDTSKLDNVTVIEDEEQAMQEFREICGLDNDEGVFIPSINEVDGIIHAESTNAFLYPIESDIETFINEFIM
jgi:hypothetical protein